MMSRLPTFFLDEEHRRLGVDDILKVSSKKIGVQPST